MAFLETPRFPSDLSYGSSGGPEFSTTVIILGSGYEQRNVNWQEARHRYDVAYGIKDIMDLEALKEYFIVAQGRAHGFRFKDFLDFSTAGITGTPTNIDVQFGTGDGTVGPFQLVKTYTEGATTRSRVITKPVDGTILIAVDGTPKTEGSHYSVDYSTGLVTFTGGNAPAIGEVITWGGEFDVPCRFDTDRLSTVLDEYQLGSTQVPVIEIKV